MISGCRLVWKFLQCINCSCFKLFSKDSLEHSLLVFILITSKTSKVYGIFTWVKISSVVQVQISVLTVNNSDVTGALRSCEEVTPEVVIFLHLPPAGHSCQPFHSHLTSMMNKNLKFCKQPWMFTTTGFSAASLTRTVDAAFTHLLSSFIDSPLVQPGLNAKENWSWSWCQGTWDKSELISQLITSISPRSSQLWPGWW